MEDFSLITDEELVRLSLNEKRFFAELLNRYEKKLSAYIYRLGKLSPEDREDILQEVFLKAYINLNSFDCDFSFSSWIYRITHNETMSFFRKRKVRPVGHSVELSEEILAAIASDFNLVHDVEKKDDAKRLNEHIAQLSQAYREVLILRFFEEKTYDEISDILSLPSGTVAVRINRAKKELQKAMIGEGYTYG